MNIDQESGWGRTLAIACIGLLAAAFAGCAPEAADVVAASDSAVTAPDEIRSINDQDVDFALVSVAPGARGFSVVRGDRRGLKVETAAFRFSPGDQTLTVLGATGNPADLQIEAPKTVVRGATWRIAIFRTLADGTTEGIADAESGLNLFERITVSGDKATFTTVTSSGEKVTGRLALPDLSSGKGDYVFTAVPRDVPRGSILGTHFFEMRGAIIAKGPAKAL